MPSEGARSYLRLSILLRLHEGRELGGKVLLPIDIAMRDLVHRSLERNRFGGLLPADNTPCAPHLKQLIHSISSTGITVFSKEETPIMCSRSMCSIPDYIGNYVDKYRDEFVVLLRIQIDTETSNKVKYRPLR